MSVLSGYLLAGRNGWASIVPGAMFLGSNLFLNNSGAKNDNSSRSAASWSYIGGNSLMIASPFVAHSEVLAGQAKRLTSEAITALVKHKSINITKWGVGLMGLGATIQTFAAFKDKTKSDLTSIRPLEFVAGLSGVAICASTFKILNTPEHLQKSLSQAFPKIRKYSTIAFAALSILDPFVKFDFKNGLQISNGRDNILDQSKVGSGIMKALAVFIMLGIKK